MQNDEQKREVSERHLFQAFDNLNRSVDEYVSRGYDVVMFDGEIDNRTNREARALVAAELPQ